MIRLDGFHCWDGLIVEMVLIAGWLGWRLYYSNLVYPFIEAFLCNNPQKVAILPT